MMRPRFKKDAPKPAQPAPAVIVPSASMLTGNRKDHTWVDYVYLVVVLAVVVCFVLFWPVWDQMIGSEEVDDFSILGIPKTTDRGVIKRAFRGLAKQWHPDHNPGCGEDCRARMRAIQDSYNQIIKDPNAALRDKEPEVGGFNAQLLHLFLGRLFDMVFHFAEFMVRAMPGVSFTQWSAFRGLCVVGCGISMYLYLIEVGVPLSYIGIAVCVYKLKNLTQWAPAESSPQQTSYAAFVVLPVTLGYLGYMLFVHPAYATNRLALNTIAGVVYLSGFLIRTSPQVFMTYQIKRVPYLPFNIVLSLLWDIGCTDLLCYVIKVPSPFRITCQLLILAVLYQRWIYIHVGKKRLNEFGQIIGIDGEEAQMYPGMNPVNSPSSGNPGASEQPAPQHAGKQSAVHHQLTESKKLTKEERQIRQRTAPEEGSSKGLKYMLIGIVLLVTATACAPSIIEWYNSPDTAPAEPAKAPPRPSRQEEVRAEAQRMRQEIEEEQRRKEKERRKQEKAAGGSSNEPSKEKNGRPGRQKDKQKKQRK